MLVPACSTPPQTPEEQVRATIAQIAAAARQRDLAGVMRHVSEHYADAEQRDKRALKGIVAFYFLQQQSVHLLTRIETIEFPQSDRAAVRVLAAMAGRDAAGDALLPSFHGDIQRFDVTFAREGGGEWRVTSATWQPATAADLG